MYDPSYVPEVRRGENHTCITYSTALTTYCKRKEQKCSRGVIKAKGNYIQLLKTRTCRECSSLLCSSILIVTTSTCKSLVVLIREASSKPNQQLQCTYLAAIHPWRTLNKMGQNLAITTNRHDFFNPLKKSAVFRELCWHDGSKTWNHWLIIKVHWKLR